MFYTVGEMAKKLQVTPSTLRYYDKEGLLPFVERSKGGIRIFHDKDLNWLEILECMKKTGMSLKEIKQFMSWCMEGDSTIDKRLELIFAQKVSVQKKIEEMQEHLAMLEYKVWYYETAKQAGTCEIHNEMAPEQVPEKFRKFLKP